MAVAVWVMDCRYEGVDIGGDQARLHSLLSSEMPTGRLAYVHNFNLMHTKKEDTKREIAHLLVVFHPLVVAQIDFVEFGPALCADAFPGSLPYMICISDNYVRLKRLHAP